MKKYEIPIMTFNTHKTGSPLDGTRFFDHLETPVRLAQTLIRDTQNACFIIFVVSDKMELLCTQMVETSHDSELIPPQDIMRTAIVSYASDRSGIFALRKNSLGNTDPSDADVRYAFELAKAALYIDMHFYDYIILGNDAAYFSLAQKNMLPTFGELCEATGKQTFCW